jgi:hypothetical protein
VRVPLWIAILGLKVQEVFVSLELGSELHKDRVGISTPIFRSLDLEPHRRSNFTKIVPNPNDPVL